MALRHGIDYKELAQWNGIVNPNTLKIGQEIDLSVPSKQKAVFSTGKSSNTRASDYGAADTVFSLSANIILRENQATSAISFTT